MTQKLLDRDQIGTGAILDAARRVAVRHLIYISIVGCDQIPFGYYVRKTAVEQAVASSNVPYTILRTTQYFEFAAMIAEQLSRPGVALVPKGVRFQALDTLVAARRLAALAEGPPQGRAPDIGGPEPLLLADMVRGYLRAIGRRTPVVQMPLFGAAYRGFVAGHNLSPSHGDHSGRTWEQWLGEQPARRERT